ncbi:MAG: AMP-binding protein [Verrucomicrobiia bacterium]|jgi:phenylacetate-coenzyme A ligase PaaK-like adenylate-forming protein
MNWDRLTVPEQRRIQNEKLHRYLTEVIAPFSPYYKRLFAEHHVDPRLIKTVNDLRQMPFTAKADLLSTSEQPEKFREFIITPDLSVLKHRPRVLAEALWRGRSVVERRFEREYRPIFLTATTGRSSLPVAFTYTDYDMYNLRISGARLIQTFAATTKMRGVNMFPYAPHLAFWQVVYAGLEFGMLLVSSGGGKVMGTDGNINLIEKIKPEALIGIPTFVYHVIREAQAQGNKWPQVTKVVLGGEKSPQGIRRKIVTLLQEMGAGDVRVCGTYGFTEARVAWGECPTLPEESSGYHLFPDFGVFEVIDPETGEVKGEGEPGELVYTPLDARGTVVLRYRTGDYVDGGVTWEPCPHCGRTVPRIVGNIGRASNTKELQFGKLKGTIVNFDTLQQILDNTTEIGEWQLEIRKAHDDPHDVDELILHLAPVNGANVEQLKEKVRTRFQTGVELTPNRIEVHSIDDMLKRIKLESSLKEVRILDARPKE